RQAGPAGTGCRRRKRTKKLNRRRLLPVAAPVAAGRTGARFHPREAGRVPPLPAPSTRRPDYLTYGPEILSEAVRTVSALRGDDGGPDLRRAVCVVFRRGERAQKED